MSRAPHLTFIDLQNFIVQLARHDRAHLEIHMMVLKKYQRQSLALIPKRVLILLLSVAPASVVVPPQQEESMEVQVTPAQGSRAVYVIIADLKWGQRDLRQWCEAMLTIEP